MNDHTFAINGTRVATLKPLELASMAPRFRLLVHFNHGLEHVRVQMVVCEGWR
jgi:hypothetical protein